jgi:hypothetical protein
MTMMKMALDRIHREIADVTSAASLATTGNLFVRKGPGSSE